MKKNLVIIGAGGYAKSVVDSVDTTKYTIAGFIDEFSDKGEHLGFPILSKSLDELEGKESYVYFIAIGNNLRRKRWYDILSEKGYEMINVIDPSAIVSQYAHLGIGCFVGKMAIVNSKAFVGNDCIINSKALVEHGCHVSDHANISTNSVINGDVVIGEGSFIGSCSVTIGQLSVGNWSTVGAGAVVIRNVGDGVTVAGVPAKKIKEEAMLG